MTPLERITWSVTLDPSARNLRRRSRIVAAELARNRLGMERQQLLTVLGAIQHTLWRDSGDSELIISALENTGAAAALDPFSEAAHFNLALITGDLGLRRVSSRLWSELLDRSGDSQWASEGEARRSFITLEEEPPALVEKDVCALFESLVYEKLPSLPTLRLDALDEIRELEARAAELADITGDSSLTRLFVEMRAQREPARQGLEAYLRGRSLFRQEEYGPPTIGALERARTRLSDADSVLEPWTHIWLAGTEIYSGAFRDATDRLQRLLDRLRPDELMVRGKAHWVLGLAHGREGSLQEALDYLSSAIALYRRCGCREQEVAVLTLQAEALEKLGLGRLAWPGRLRAIRALNVPGPHFALHNALVEGSEAARLQGRARTAETLSLEALALASEADDPESAAEARLARAAALESRGRADPALAQFQQVLEASRDLPRIPAERFRNAALLGIHNPALQRASEHETAIRSLELVADYFVDRGPPWLYIRALRHEAGWLARIGNVQGQRRALSEAVAAIEEIGSQLDRRRLSVPWKLGQQRIFDDLIEMEAATGRWAEALELLERSRQAGKGQGRPHELSNFYRTEARRAGNRAVWVVYAWLPSKVAWWAIDGPRVETGLIEHSELVPTVQAVAARAPTGSVDDRDLEKLYDLLIATPLRGTSHGRPLVLIPDGPLRLLPFAAFRNSRSGVRLIEQRALSFEVSLAGIGRDPEGSEEQADRADWKAVIVGNPTHDRATLPGLDPLPHGVVEAETVASLYPESEVLIGGRATWSAVQQRLASAQVFHLAAHALLDEASMGTALVLAADPELDSSGLIAGNAIRIEGNELELVVLSACSSIGRHTARVGGSFGVAQAFLDSGVSAVVGTLWPVRDGGLVGLMEDFHRGLLEGLPASAALQRAQMAASNSTRDLECCDWASVQLIGELPARSPEMWNMH